MIGGKSSAPADAAEVSPVTSSDGEGNDQTISEPEVTEDANIPKPKATKRAKNPEPKATKRAK